MRKNISIESGSQFERLTVVNWSKVKKAYECICSCGNTSYQRAWALRTGKVKSCGCKNLEPRPHKRKPEHVSAKQEVYKNYKQAAKRREYAFELTLEEFVSIILQPCHYCGIEASLTSPLAAHKDFKYNGVDRVDNHEGYVLDNCVPCCDICNNSKSTLTTEQWLNWICRVYTQQFE